MKIPVKLFKRDGKHWLPYLLASEPNKAKDYLRQWTDVNNFPTQEEINEAFSKLENLLLRLEDFECDEMTNDFMEALILFISACKEFLECHNADNVMRDILVSCSKVVLLLIDPLSLHDNLEKLKNNAVHSAKVINDTEFIKKNRIDAKNTFKKRVVEYLKHSNNIDGIVFQSSKLSGENVEDADNEPCENNENTEIHDHNVNTDQCDDNQKVESHADNANTDQCDNNQKVESHVDNANTDQCDDNQKVESHVDNANTDQCDNNQKVEFHVDNANTDQCDDNQKVESHVDNANTEHCDNNQKVESHVDNANTEHCDNNQKVESHADNTNTENCDDNQKVESHADDVNTELIDITLNVQETGSNRSNSTCNEDMNFDQAEEYLNNAKNKNEDQFNIKSYDNIHDFIKNNYKSLGDKISNKINFDLYSDCKLKSDAVENEGKFIDKNKERFKEVTRKLRSKIEDRISKENIMKKRKTLWNFINDPEIKALWDEFFQILKHLIETMVSGRIISGKYAIEPLKALKNRRSFVYGGISPALERALNAPMASTLKNIVMATMELPAKFMINAEFMQPNVRLSCINDILSSDVLDKRSYLDNISENYNNDKKGNDVIPIMFRQLRRTKSLSDIDLFHAARPILDYIDEIRNKNTNKSRKATKENFEEKNSPVNETNGGDNNRIKITIKRSHSFDNAMIKEKKSTLTPTDAYQKSLDEWLLKNEVNKSDVHNEEIYNIDSRTENENERVHSINGQHNNEDASISVKDWTFKESVTKLKEISKRTKIASSVRSTLLRKGNYDYLKTNFKDILNPKMRDRLIKLIETIESGNYSIILAILIHLCDSYSDKFNLTSERKKLFKHLKKLLKTLISQENIDTLYDDIQELKNTSTYIKLKTVTSLRRYKNDPDINLENLVQDLRSETKSTNEDGSIHKRKKYARILAESVIELIESNQGRNVIADLIDVYMSIKLEKNTKMLAKTYKLLTMTYKHYNTSNPSYVILINVFSDIFGKVIPRAIKESKMISIPLHKVIDIKGFELFFTKEPNISIKELVPEKLKINIEHRTTSPESIRKITCLENDKHVLASEPIRNIVKFILKQFPTSMNRFHKWDISEGEKGPKWFIRITLKGIYFIMESEEVKLLATNRNKGTMGNNTYKILKNCNKIIPKRNKGKSDMQKSKNVNTNETVLQKEKLETKNELVSEEKNEYIFANKKFYSIWTGSVDGLVYGDGINLDFIFETVPPNEDDIQDANVIVKKIHRKLSHSEAIKKGKYQKLKKKPVVRNRKNKKSLKNFKRKENLIENKYFKYINEHLLKPFNDKNKGGETFRFAGVKVDVPYYSTRLRVKGAMGSFISIFAEKKIRELIKESIEDYIVKLISKLNYEKDEIKV